MLTWKQRLKRLSVVADPDVETVVDIYRALVKTLAANQAHIHPSSYQLSTKQLNDYEGVKFIILLHQLHTHRADKLVCLASQRWYLIITDTSIWKSTLGRAATIKHMQDLVATIEKYVTEAEPMSLN